MEEKANQYKEKGNQHFKKKQYEDAIREYTNAINCDGDNPIFFSNRAQGYISLKKWKEAVMDAEKAIILDPNDCKSFYRLGIALKQMGKYLEALWAFNHFVDISDFAKEIISIVMILQKITSPTMTGPILVELATSQEKGRHYVALRDINAGEMLFQEKAYAYVPDNPRMCFYCLSYDKSQQVSCQCGYLFCSSKCQNEMGDFHKMECDIISYINKQIDYPKTLNPEVLNDYKRNLIILSRIFLRRYLETSSFVSNKQFCEIYSLLEKPEKQGHNLSYIFELEQYPEISSQVLDKQFSDMFSLLEEPEKEILFFVSELLEILTLHFNDESFLPQAKLIREVFEKLNRNAIGIGSGKSCGIYPNASFFNHSCYPNSNHVHITSGVIDIYAMEDIKKGEEVTFCYSSPEFLKPVHLRQNWLQDNYYFICKCRRCSQLVMQESFLTGVKCIKSCCSGYMERMSIDNPVMWKCMECSYIPDTALEEKLKDQEYKLEMALLLKNKTSHKLFCEQLKELLVTNDNLHPNHYLILRIKIQLADLYAGAEIDDLQGALQLNNEILACYHNLMPNIVPESVLMEKVRCLEFIYCSSFFKGDVQKAFESKQEGENILHKLYIDNKTCCGANSRYTKIAKKKCKKFGQIHVVAKESKVLFGFF